MFYYLLSFSNLIDNHFKVGTKIRSDPVVYIPAFAWVGFASTKVFLVTFLVIEYISSPNTYIHVCDKINQITQTNIIYVYATSFVLSSCNSCSYWNDYCKPDYKKLPSAYIDFIGI